MNQYASEREEKINIGESLVWDEETDEPSHIEIGKSDRLTGRYLVMMGDAGIIVKPVSDITYQDQEKAKEQAEKYNTYFYAEVSRAELGEAIQELAFGEVKLPMEEER